MTTPAIVPAAMIALVALAATFDRRDRAAALWLGIALGLSGWALIAAAPILTAFSRRQSLAATLPITALATSTTTIVLALAARPHALAGLGLAPVALLAVSGAAGLVLPRLRAQRPPILTQRIG